MATEKTALRVTELDFHSIKDNLKAYLKAQDEFQDYNFEGSGLNALLDILAYNTHYMAWYTNQVGNEMFLDSAQLRPSVLSHAGLLGYVPASSQGASAQVDILVTPSATEDQDQESIVLERFTKLLGRDIDGVNYPFVTLNANTAIVSDGSFQFSNIAIKQGEVITRQFLMDTVANERREFVLASANCDISTIRVAVQESVANVDTKIYTRNRDIVEIDGDSLVYYVYENEDLTYTIQFGDNTLGKSPKHGNVIIISYLDNVGTAANNISSFVFTEPVAGLYLDDISFSNVVTSYGGVAKETTEQARFRAPYYYTTQNRAVTYHDYETLILANYNNIEAASVWGGEDNDPVVYGKVFLSLKTRGNYQLTNFEKEQLKDDLIRNFNITTIIPEFVDPSFVYLNINAAVKYKAALTSFTASELESLIRVAVSEFNAEHLNSFSATFKKGVLQNAINNSDPSIDSSEILVNLAKLVEIDTTKSKTYEIPFDNKLARLQNNPSITTYPSISLRDSGGVFRDAYIEEIPVYDTGIHSVQILDTGRNYNNADTEVTITGDGTGAVARARINSGRIVGVDIEKPGENYTYAVITITSDSGIGASATLTLEKDVGNLRSVYFNSAGEKFVISNNVGTVNYKTGLIRLVDLRAFSVEENEYVREGFITIQANAGVENIYPLRNRILLIDPSARSVRITVTAL
jgi:hypothetical protein